MPAMMSDEELDTRYQAILGVKFDLLSALDSRYLRYAKGLIAHTSPRAVHRYNLVVLRSFHKTLMEFEHIPEKEGNEILEAAVPSKVSKEQQWEWEKKLNHDVRGLVEAVGEHLSDEAKQYLYKGPTSYDILNTSYSTSLRDSAFEVVIPASLGFMNNLLDQAEKHKDTVMAGRTHRQQAVPTTFGHYLMEVGEGFMEVVENFSNAAKNLRGKFSGICGNRASYQLLYGEDAKEIERTALEKLGLQPDNLTGQVVHQHYYSNYFGHLVQMGEVLAKFANDIRSFQQVEVGEVYEKKPDSDVGSSTAAQKTNPIGSENTGGHQRQLRCRIIPVYEDSQIDWERDLRNSSSMRYYIEMLGMYMNQLGRMSKIAKNMWVRPEVMKSNLEVTKGQIVAEALQLYTGREGLVRDAHEYVKNLARECQTKGKSFSSVVKNDKIWDSLSENLKNLIQNPQDYVGFSVSDTQERVNYCRSQVEKLNSIVQKHSTLRYDF